MYEIYKLKEDLYQIHSSVRHVQAMEGSQLAIITYCVHSLGFDPNQIEFALLDMIKRDMDGAHFGINQTFIYSFDRKKRKAG